MYLSLGRLSRTAKIICQVHPDFQRKMNLIQFSNCNPLFVKSINSKEIPCKKEKIRRPKRGGCECEEQRQPVCDRKPPTCDRRPACESRSQYTPLVFDKKPKNRSTPVCNNDRPRNPSPPRIGGKILGKIN